MPGYFCSVPECNSWSKRGSTLSFHGFPPKNKRTICVTNHLGQREKIDRHLLWIRQLKISRKVSPFMRICSLHFKDSDYLPSFNPGRRRILKQNAYPTRNLPKGASKVLELTNEDLCPKCSKQFKKNVQRILCISCQRYYHRNCTNLMGKEDGKTKDWVCFLCELKLTSKVGTEEGSELDVIKNENELLRKLVKEVEQSNTLLKESKAILEGKISLIESRIAQLEKQHQVMDDNEIKKTILLPKDSNLNTQSMKCPDTGKVKKKLIVLRKTDLKPISMKGVIPIRKISLPSVEIKCKQKDEEIFESEKVEVKTDEEKETIKAT